MKVFMRLQLKDVPGSLLRALEPISSHGGNIVNVVHTRGKKDTVDVQINFKVKDVQSLDIMKKELKKERVRISEINVEGKRYYSRESRSFILVGHVIDTDVQDTIDRINKVGMVSDIDVVMPSPDEKSSVLLNVDVDNGQLKELNGVLESICSRKKFLLIESI
ncbi:MAG: hypothetical protein V1921_01605 [Candidatus Altiarchaeota archaeon]